MSRCQPQEEASSTEVVQDRENPLRLQQKSQSFLGPSEGQFVKQLL